MACATPLPVEPTPGWLRWLALGGSACIAGTTIGDPRLGFVLLVMLELIVVTASTGGSSAGEGQDDAGHLRARAARQSRLSPQAGQQGPGGTLDVPVGTGSAAMPIT